MIFNSLEYAVFLPVVLGLYWVLRHRARLWLLLVASYVFYGWWDVRFLGLIIVSTLIDYTVARRMAAAVTERARTRLLLVSVVANLGILGTFKYADFFVYSAQRALTTFGLTETSTWTLGVLLPVGISFYTFQTISYSFDVYRRRLEPVDDLLTFAVYVAFFPQLVAGPIERAHHLLPQFQHPRPRPGRDDVRSAGVLILQGLVKKVVIADVMAGVVQTGFAGASATGARSAGSVTVLLGVYAFALQIYGDFSGYTDIARGSARLFGIDLMRNFEAPYLSRSITEFWRRWHISLSEWLRDYLYVPLGGNRGTRWRTYRNLMLTMLLGGLWHGAAWTFVVWGLLHGLFLVAHRPVRDRSRRDTGPLTRRDVLPILGTFHLVCFAWIFFRADSFGQAADVITGILSLRGGSIDVGDVVLVALAAGVLLALDLAQRVSGSHAVVLRLPATVRGVVYGGALVGLVLFSGGTPVPFLYFQF